MGVSLLLVTGCGESGPTLYPVTGTVTFESKPVDGAEVVFISDSGALATGTTGADGKYSLVSGTRPGAAPGSYKVTVTKQRTTGTMPTNPTPEDMAKMVKEKTMPKVESLLPLKYSTPQSSDLSVTVTNDKSKNDIPLDLKP